MEGGGEYRTKIKKYYQEDNRFRIIASEQHTDPSINIINIDPDWTGESITIPAMPSLKHIHTPTAMQTRWYIHHSNFCPKWPIMQRDLQTDQMLYHIMFFFSLFVCLWFLVENLSFSTLHTRQIMPQVCSWKVLELQAGPDSLRSLVGDYCGWIRA